MNTAVMGAVTASIIASGGGFRGCSSKTEEKIEPKYTIGDCVRHIDSFGDFSDNYFDKIIKINNTEYKVITATIDPFDTWTYSTTKSIDVLDKYFKKVSCIEKVK